MKRTFVVGTWIAVAFLTGAVELSPSARGEDEAPGNKEALVGPEALAAGEPSLLAPACSGNAGTLLYPLNVPGWSLVDFFGDGATGNGPATGPGLGQRNDDDSARILALGFTFNLYGDLYGGCFVNQNGNLSFANLFSTFTSVSFPSTQFRMVAGFWGDVDTRSNSDAAFPGDTYQKFVDSNGDSAPDTFVVTWDNVGYYNVHHDKRNTFQIAISDGNNPLMGLGNNVCFSYDNMCWTTGDASSGVGGFGGTPATVGVNRGNGVQYFQIGRFSRNNADFDGPYGMDDGINYLDGKLFCFSTSTTNNNICPIPANFPPGDEETLTVVQAYGRTLQFLSPEIGQTTTVTVTDPNGAQAAGLSIVNTPGNTATSQLSWTTDCSVLGDYALTFHATDNFNPPCTTDRTLTLHVTCNDGNACTLDSCNAQAGCVHTPIACDDGNPCTRDFCDPQLGCRHTDEPSGTPCGDPSSGPCDNPDSCDGQGHCVTNHVPDGTPCSDNDACTVGDACRNGLCEPGTGTPNCDDGNPCTDDGCNPTSGCFHNPNSNPCSDGSACTTNDLCVNGQCQGGPTPNCDDRNACTDDGCNPAFGCFHNNTTDPCDDGNACTTADRCSVGQCVGGPPPNCDDGNLCTTDGCNPSSGCFHTPNTEPCTDNNACTTNDRCTNGQCMGGPPPDCDDRNPCTDDSCNAATGCAHPNNTRPCNDGNACTTADRCSDGLCVGGPPPNCDDANPCTDDSCNPSTGCVHVNNTAPCNDGNACTTADRCNGGQCVGGPPPNCNDNNQCTADGCNPASGCFHNPNPNVPCNDGNACTTADRCDAAGTSCVGGPPPDCDDGNTCTDDSCNPATGCVHLPNNTCGANPKTQGYWKRLCKGPHPSGDAYTQVDVDCVNNTCAFATVQTMADICDRLYPNPNNDKCEQAEAQFMALMLNICRGRVVEGQPIDSSCTTNTTVGQSRADADALLCSPARNQTTCTRAQCESEEINSGKALWTNSLRVQRLAGGTVKLTWSAPYVTPDWEAPGQYKVWGRTGSEQPFVLLTQTSNMNFTHTPPAGVSYQYEISAVW